MCILGFMSGCITLQLVWTTKMWDKEGEKRFKGLLLIIFSSEHSSALLRVSYTWFFGVCGHQQSFPQPQQSGLNVCAVHSPCPEGSAKGIYLLNDVQTARFNRWQLKHSTSDHQWCGFYFGILLFLKKKMLPLLTFFKKFLFSSCFSCFDVFFYSVPY